MSYKIYKTGAFVIVEDSTSNLTSEFNSQTVQIEKLQTAVPSYSFLVDGNPAFTGMFLGDITDGLGNPYTSNSFDTFRFTQVGKQNVDGVGTQGPTGATGAQGPIGPTGAQGIAGAVGPAGLNWEGSWSSGTSYVADDAVGYNGASYFCILATSGTTTPDLDTTHWALLASQGAIGPVGPVGPVGPQGIIGAVGPAGPTGATGATGPQGIQGTPGAAIPNLEYNATDATVWNNGKNNISSNTAFGESTLVSLTSATGVSAFGQSTLGSLTSGSGTTAFGQLAGAALTTGLENAFFGNSAGGNNVNGDYNTAIGVRALLIGTTGSHNTAIGYQSLLFNRGSSNTAVGQNSLYANTTGGFNVAIGVFAGGQITTGSSNNSFGYFAHVGLTTGGNNIAIGNNAVTATASTSFSVVVGNNAVAGPQSVVIGQSASSAVYAGCVVLGANSLATANNQFVVGSTGQNAGAVTTESLSSTQTWTVVINGVTRKILLA